MVEQSGESDTSTTTPTIPQETTTVNIQENTERVLFRKDAMIVIFLSFRLPCKFSRIGSFPRAGVPSGTPPHPTPHLGMYPPTPIIHAHIYAI